MYGLFTFTTTPEHLLLKPVDALHGDHALGLKFLSPEVNLGLV